MRTVIINRFAPERTPYKEWLNDLDHEFIMVTKTENTEKDYGSIFSQIIGFNNFDVNDNVYKCIVDLHKHSKIDHIVATNEFDLLKAGRIRDFLQIAGQSGDSAKAFRDKVYMKQLASSSIRVPNFSKINDIVDLLSFIDKYGYPVVIKPVDSAGSMDVAIIRDECQLTTRLAKGLDTNLEVEEFILGEMYHVDGFFGDGRLQMSRPSRYINGCMAFNDDKYLGSVMLQPGPVYHRLNKAVASVLNALPTPGNPICFHAEFFLTENDEIVLCEIASRAGGGNIIEAMEFATGINILKESVRSQCGGTIEFNNIQERLVGFLLIPAREGILRRMESEIPFPWVIQCNAKPENIGKSFSKAESSADFIASILVEGDNETQITQRLGIVYGWMQNRILWEEPEQQSVEVKS